MQYSVGDCLRFAAIAVTTAREALMSDKTADKLAAIEAEAEVAETDQTDRPIPAHVTVGRPRACPVTV